MLRVLLLLTAIWFGGCYLLTLLFLLAFYVPAWALGQFIKAITG